MNDEKVFAPFIEEIDDALRDSIARQQKAIRQSDLTAMEEEAARQKNLVSARRQLEELQETWSQLVGRRKPGIGQPSRGWDEQSQPSEQAQSTPPERYVLPILQALVEFGGSASATEVTDRVGQLMDPILSESDHDSFPSGRVRWRAYASGARSRMVREGLLADGSARGVWEITERGWKYLREHQGRTVGHKALTPESPKGSIPVRSAFEDRSAEIPRTTLEVAFYQAMLDVYKVAAEHGYRATYFKRMLDQYGGVKTAKRLLAKQEIQDGLMRLWKLDLLAHSTEAAVLQDRFHPLFTKAELKEARRRLERLGFFSDE